MKSADTVIGANFGDEGKGLITDFLSARQGENAVVVRFNGGAQAAHTVQTPGGQRHVFSHFGSGSLVGAATLLSRFFVCNPLLFRKEHDRLSALSCSPTIYIDNRAIVTTPYEMMLNQIAEEARGKARHGSCGVGFGETIERHDQSGYEIVYGDLENASSLRDKLISIRQDWLPKRLKALGVDVVSPTWEERIYSDGILQKFLDDTLFLTQTATAVDASFLQETKKKIIFEGAQGLLLDQGHAWFPHVTRSHTGLHNVRILAEEAGVEHLKTTYITRAYLTRHGAGPLPGELDGLPYPRVTDATNVHNQYQGTLRFAPLDVDLLAASIRDDLRNHSGAVQVEHGLAVTCLDQVDESHYFMKDGMRHKTNESEFIALLQEKTGAQFLLKSHGPTRDDVSG